MPHLGKGYSSSADIGRTIFTVSLIHKLLCHFGRYLQNSPFSFWTVITCWMLDSIITLQGFMIVDRSALYGSRNMLDQHRDMRLDIDNMSYEVIYWVLVSSTTLFLLLLCFFPPLKFCAVQELLALGERIGSVSTGLSEDLISKCVTETIYCSSDLIQEEGTCVICLVRFYFYFLGFIKVGLGLQQFSNLSILHGERHLPNDLEVEGK